jgi:hypothetical protein
MRSLCSGTGEKGPSFVFKIVGDSKIMKVFDTRIGFYIFEHWRLSASWARSTSFIEAAVFCPELMYQN